MLLLLLGCGTTPEESTPTDTAPTTGTVALHFQLDSVLLSYVDQPPVGAFWGSIYLSEDVTGLGPSEDARPLEDVFVVAVDLSDLTLPALYTTAALPVGRLTVLGFVDTDGNAVTDSPDPDDGDPVTLPGENGFDVSADTTTDVTVFFGLLNP